MIDNEINEKEIEKPGEQLTEEDIASIVGGKFGLDYGFLVIKCANPAEPHCFFSSHPVCCLYDSTMDVRRSIKENYVFNSLDEFLRLYSPYQYGEKTCPRCGGNKFKLSMGAL